MKNNKEKTFQEYIKITCFASILFMPAQQVFANDFLNVLKDTLDKSLKTMKEKAAQLPTSRLSKNPAVLGKSAVKNSKQQAKEQTITYEDYSKDFLPIKKHIAAGEMKEAYEWEQSNIKDEGVNFLNSVEAGLLSIDTNHTLDAIDDFTKAEGHLKEIMGRSVVTDSVTNYGGQLLSAVSGKGDLAEYRGEPFERILMLNYKSIAYLLNGERKAYNVTRRAIDWQNIEKKEFEKSIEAVEKQVEIAKGADEKKETEKQKDEKDRSFMSSSPTVFKTIFGQYNRHKSKAMSVSSAYINPFGYYMAGIIQEFDSYEDASLRDNARISYKKALELSPKSKVIKRAIKATKKRPPKNKRLVHIVVADGFAPEKKTLSFMMAIAGSPVMVKTPLYEPVISKVKTIKIKVGKKILATLSPIADIEAITLRHQLDNLPTEHAKVLASIGRNVGENILWSQLGGAGVVGKMFRESFANPDMRSWMTLPKKISAARFYVSKKLKKITIVSYDKKGIVLAKKNVDLNKKSHNFIYARTIDKHIHAQINKKLWMKTK